MKPFFSIVTVSLNSGDKLLETQKSVEEQLFHLQGKIPEGFSDFEVIIKDGGSKDDSIDKLQEYLKLHEDFASRVKIVREKDKSIYEGMNQAIAYTTGEYLVFMNCGDAFYEKDTLAKVLKAISERKEQTIYYGNLYDALRNQVVSQNPNMDAFGCYRNVPCHQSCFYHRALFEERGYEPRYKVRADYEHFLWCFFVKKISPKFMPVVIASYEGGGFSETGKNKQRSKEEHKEITEKYMTKGQLIKFKLILLLTLAPLRTKMAESKRFSGLYNKLRKSLYKG